MKTTKLALFLIAMVAVPAVNASLLGLDGLALLTPPRTA